MKFTVILKLTAAAIAASTVNAAESLKSKAGNFRIGVAVDASKFNNQAYIQAMSNFNYAVAENSCKMVGIQPQRGTYNFSACDNHMNKAKELGMAFRGHCLVWHSMPPSWFQGLKGDDLKKAMTEHITKTLQHYEGKIDTWDVVNEAIDDSSNGPQWKMRPSFLYQNIPDFVDLAFKTARAASSTTKLFYNDYNTEGIWGKSEAVFNFVKDMKSRGIPIDGVGLQYHVSTQNFPKYDKINQLIGDYCKLGLEVHITEMDVKGGNNAQVQAQVYSEALKACLSNSCCTAFLVWGVGDNDSWLGANEKGLLFDGSYQPKTAYNSLLETLGGTPAAASSNPAPAAAPANEQSQANNQPAQTNEQPQQNNQQPQQPQQNNEQPQQPQQNNEQPQQPQQNNQQPQQPQQNNQQPQQPQQNNEQPQQPQQNNQQPQQQPQQNTQWNNNQWNQGQWNQWGNNNNNQQSATANTNTNTNTNNGNCAGLWAQCGGIGFSGPTCCQEGMCKVLNEYFSQCINSN